MAGLSGRAQRQGSAAGLSGSRVSAGLANVKTEIQLPDIVRLHCETKAILTMRWAVEILTMRWAVEIDLFAVLYAGPYPMTKTKV